MTSNKVRSKKAAYIELNVPRLACAMMLIIVLWSAWGMVELLRGNYLSAFANFFLVLSAGCLLGWADKRFFHLVLKKMFEN